MSRRTYENQNVVRILCHVINSTKDEFYGNICFHVRLTIFFKVKHASNITLGFQFTF